MRLFLDTSALLRAEVERDVAMRKLLAAATGLFASRLLKVEAARALHRLALERRPGTAALERARVGIATAIGSCSLATLDDAVIARAEREFPAEPVRSLDAIHLAAALWWREKLSASPGEALSVASTDERLRKNAVALGFTVLPRA